MIRLALRALAVAGIALGALALAAWAWRPGMAQYAAQRWVSPPDAQGPTATWLGVTALLLRDGDSALMIDPFFSRPPGLLRMALDREIAPDETLIRDWLRKLGVTRLDAVLVSHSHFDHAMDAGVVARLTGATLIGSDSTLQIGRGAGLGDAQLQRAVPGHTTPHGAFKVRFIESRHAGATGGAPTGDIAAPLTPPARYLDYKLGAAYSIVVEHARGRLLHHGSAGFVSGALAGERADVVFLGVALIDDLDSYLRETVDAVGARRVVPTHWDDFTRPLDAPLKPFPVVVNLARFFDGMARLRPEVQARTLALGEPVALFP